MERALLLTGIVYNTFLYLSLHRDTSLAIATDTKSVEHLVTAIWKLSSDVLH